MHLAVGFTGVGFLLIALGWNGAASLDHVQGQVPYLISGGLAGLGLIGLGLMLAIVQELRRTNAGLTARIDALTDLVAGERPTGALPSAVPVDGTAVVAGASTFHLPACELVAGRERLQPMRPQDAVRRGLAPCRVCRPVVDVVG
ncbi:hypothetical protein [Egicoccus sp. AB-alg2]|uniref:hypothetical protein n=1 Tax=Egicoccus sp. AB-alg2 TaxID=3242693 RepID=UPI00359E69FB